MRFRAFEIATKSGRAAAFLRTKVFPLVVSLVFHFRLARRFLFRAVSQIAISYHDSPLSVGRAGRIRGGDRLPWVSLGAGDAFEDNLAALASLRWQTHVYGTAPNELRRACDESGIELHVFEWRAAMARSGVARDGLYLVRPDGYVALADARCSADRLRAYVAAWRLGHDLPGA